jgi:hypothetical protein
MQRAGTLHAANAALQQTQLFKMHDQGDIAIFMCALRPGRAAHTSESASATPVGVGRSIDWFDC